MAKKRITDVQRKRRGIAVREKRKDVRKKVHDFGKKQLKRGTHPQMWRAAGPGGRLGPMGPLGDDVIIEIKFKPAMKSAWDLTKLNETETKTAIEDAIFTPLEEYLKSKIKVWVPKDTGNLRRQLLATVSNSFATIDHVSTARPFRVSIGTPGVEYANVVNKMPTRWLQHPGTHPPGTKGRRRKPLNDPEARRGWYNLLLLNGRREARSLYKDFLKNHIVVLITKPASAKVKKINPFKKNPNSKVRTLFTVKFK
jgi:hypothetical protein